MVSETLNLLPYGSLLTNKYRMDMTQIANVHQQGVEAMAKLRAGMDAVDFARVGLVSITKPMYISGETLNRLARVVVAQCFFDGIAATEEGLCLRNINPSEDLRWGHNEEPLYTYEWS